MLVASDDPRVIGEYGKTLAEKGRAQDAVQFLTRATELQPNDWSFYSALGVAYDQVGDQSSARMAYEHALKLNPNEPSILNNYALSRMLANDPDTARQLIARAQTAGGASDPKIARNIELVNKLAPVAPHRVRTEDRHGREQAREQACERACGPVNSSPLPAAAPSAQNTPRSRIRQPLCGRARQGGDAACSGRSAGRAGEVRRHPCAHAADGACGRPGQTGVKAASAAGEKPTARLKNDAPKSDALKSDVKADGKLAAKTDAKPVKADTAKLAAAVNTDTKAQTQDRRREAGSQARKGRLTPTPDAKSPTKPASKTAIPDLRQRLRLLTITPDSALSRVAGR